MPRRRRDEAVAERAGQILAEQTPRRRRGAQQGAQTRRRGRQAPEGEVQAQVEPEAAAQGRVTRQRRERVHEDLLTVSFRGPLATRFRETAERHQLSLAKLVQDALLAYEGHVSNGYEPGSALTEWKARQSQANEAA